MYNELLNTFGFRALWNPGILLFMAGIAAAYLGLVGSFRSYFKDSAPVPLSKKILFLTGLLIFYLAYGGPLYLLGHLMFSAHMLQMAMLYFFVPPLLILGLPDWFLRAILQIPGVNPVIRFFTHPFPPLLLFNGFFSIYHLPYVFDQLTTRYFLHIFYLLFLFALAVMVWWTIIDPLPQTSRLSPLKKIAFIFAEGALLTPACALLIFANQPLYKSYTDPDVWLRAMEYCLPPNFSNPEVLLGGPGTFALLPPLEDQQLGGILMKILQEITYGIALGYVFIQWIKTEKLKEQYN